LKNNTPHWQSKQGQQLHFSFFFYEEDQNTEEPDLSTEAPEDCNHCQSNIIEIFQESGGFCLLCWQEKTYPNL
jgi:hypothetical protein